MGGMVLETNKEEISTAIDELAKLETQAVQSKGGLSITNILKR